MLIMDAAFRITYEVGCCSRYFSPEGFDMSGL